MSKLKVSKSVVRKAGADAPSGVWRGVVLHLFAMLAFAGCLAAVVVSTRRYVDQRVAMPVGPLKVVLVNRPVWMSDFLAQQIAATVPRATSSAFDHELLVSAAKKLQANPWVRDVRMVRRVFGERPGDTLEVDCDFRAPIALVHWGEFYWLVDGEGFKLPEQFTLNHVPKIVCGRDGRMNIRIIDGVKEPPPETGRKWMGQDLMAGLGMVKLLYGKPFLEGVVAVSVANFDGRVDDREAQIVLRTKSATEIRWGLPLDSKAYFAEVPASQKLESLRIVLEKYGRLDAGLPWIDIRYDNVTVPSPDAAQASGR